MQAWHKAEKQKAIKKGKSQALAARQEKLAKRNPARLEQQIDDLKSLPAPTTYEKRQLAELERDLAAVKKARAAAGVADEPRRKRQRGGDEEDTKKGNANVVPLGKERTVGTKGGEDKGFESDSSTETTASVREIPLPSGPLPPLPGEKVEEVKTTYGAAPILRDLRKEAAAFVPAVVKRKLEAQRERSTSMDAEDEDGEDAERDDAMAEDEADEEEPERKKAREADAMPVAAQPAAAPLGLLSSVKINAAPDVDVDGELNRFQTEIEEVADEG